MHIRISYSIINLWLAGQYEDAIMALTKKKWREPTEAMQFGTDKHKEWEDFANDKKTLPKEFGGEDIDGEFHTEIKIEKKITSWITLVGVIDLENLPRLVDYKTGQGSATQYASSKQHKVYKVLFPQAKVFDYLHYNQYEDRATMQRIHLTEQTLEEGIDIVVSVACDIRATLENMGIEL